MLHYQTSIINFFKITKEKVILTLIFPFIGILTLFSGLIFDEVLGMGGSTIANVIYSLSNYLYPIIFLPLNFVDDLTSSVIMKLAIISTLIWWYFLSCVLIFLKVKGWKK